MNTRQSQTCTLEYRFENRLESTCVNLKTSSHADPEIQAPKNEVLKGLLRPLRDWLLQPGLPLLALSIRNTSGEIGAIFESSELRARWMTPRGEFLYEDASYKLEELLTSERILKLQETLSRSMKHSPPWPLPNGKLPVRWSSSVSASFVRCFLQCLESDELRMGSFVGRHVGTFDFAFTLADDPPFKTDSEGTATSPRTILANGKIRSLATNSLESEWMEIPKTGHARQTSMDDPSVPGFWNVHVVPHEERIQAAESPNWGIHVSDILIRRFDLCSGMLSFSIPTPRLIHEGAVGEPLEPLSLELPISELLGSWSAFSGSSLPSGFVNLKNGQRYCTQIHCPTTLSEHFPIPGSVPIQHYW